MQHCLHTLERFATSYSLNDTVAAVRHHLSVSLPELRRLLGPVPADPFDAKMRLVQWLRETHGCDAVDEVDRLLKGSARLETALGDAGHTLEKLLLDDELERKLLAWMRAEDERDFWRNVWRRDETVLARQLLLWRLQQFLDLPQTHDKADQ